MFRPCKQAQNNNLNVVLTIFLATVFSVFPTAKVCRQKIKTVLKITVKRIIQNGIWHQLQNYEESIMGNMQYTAFDK